MRDPDKLLLGRETLDIIDRNTPAHVTFIVCSPILHEVTNILDVDTSTWDLPKSSVGRLATSTRLTLIASLLEELAAQACS